MLDDSSLIPLYYQLKEILKEKIKEGSWKEGENVPSETQLMKTYDVSRATVRKALGELLVEGLIYRKQGIGTFVSENKIIQNLIGELSFNLQALKQGLFPSSKVIYAALETSLPKRIINLFQLDSSEEVHKIIRVRLVNEHPLVLETLYIPKKYAPNILLQDLEKIAIFKYLEKECNLTFTHSTLEIEPVLITDFEAKQLEVDIGQPALSLERVINSKGNVVAIQKRMMRGDRGKFTLSSGLDPRKKEDYVASFEFI